ncbi:MAG: 50S ribosomal protein L21 [Alphaproteobacteria bacterium]|nr:50S ribosomal protein L21 [Alphaproteobacteria bacterium]
MFAVIKTGGKQYRVEPDDIIRIERIAGEAGDEVAFDSILMLGAAGDTTVGAPLVDGAKVVGTLMEQARDKKIIVFKKKRRKNYRRRNGHRQELSIVRITDITAPGAKAAAAETAAKKVPAKAEAAVAAETETKSATKAADKPAAKKADKATDTAAVTKTAAAKAKAKPAAKKAKAKPAAKAKDDAADSGES